MAAMFFFNAVMKVLPQPCDVKGLLFWHLTGKYAAEVVYRGYGPTYRFLYTIYYGECAADKQIFCLKNASRNEAIFAQKVYRIYAATSQYLSSYIWLCNHHGIYIYSPL